jgi:hypothetical protein
METIPDSAQCSKGEMYFNVGYQALVVLLGAAALRKKPRQLTALLLGWVLNLTAFRFNTCMNCDYYGEDCHLGWGGFTAKLFKRKGEPDRDAFRRRFPINFYYLLLLFAIPMPAMRENRRLLLAYNALLTVGNISLIVACRKCSMKDVCPLGERVERFLPSQGS